jgi:microsomal dipeptidase-like Zn-dependent dipeptidase
MRRALVVALLILAVLVLTARPAVELADRILNATESSSPWVLDERSLTVHSSLWVCDLHCDALLWNRGILTRCRRGHVDLPRLIEGGVELQVFSVVTRHYLASNYRRTPPLFDLVTLLAAAQGWPRSSWLDPHRRALVQARVLRDAARASGGRLRVVEDRADLDSTIAEQARGRTVVGAILLLEGMHGLGSNVALVDTLFAAGFRVFGLTHMFDNDVAGSSSGWRKRGLTAAGRRVVARLDSLGALIDLAHASPATIDEVLSLSRRPVLISHTGVESTCPGTRNVSDDVIERVARRGGLIGIGFWPRAVCGDDAAAIARAVVHAVRVSGVGHVALGSDFDGSVRTPFDATGLPLVTEALLQQGFSYDEIAAVMGGNARRFFRENLPGPRAD